MHRDSKTDDNHGAAYGSPFTIEGNMADNKPEIISVEGRMRAVMMHMRKVTFNERDEQFAGYQRAVQGWLTQWTAQNNFKAVVVPVGCERLVLRYWKSDFLRTVKTAMGSYIPYEYRNGYNFGLDFVFHFHADAIAVGTPFWLPSGVEGENMLVSLIGTPDMPKIRSHDQRYINQDLHSDFNDD
jgi:hypothetical protein